MPKDFEDLNKIEAVTERDIDMLLIEELNVSHEFSSWFLDKLPVSRIAAACKGAWHSVIDPQLGESDIVTLFDNGLAVLIENKVDAVAQPEQGLRYLQRGEKGIKEGIWTRFISCIIAPQRYLERETDCQSYQVTISYEEIVEYFRNRDDDPRHSYKAYVLQEAIEQNRRGYKAIPDERVSAFWMGYWNLVHQIAPELEMTAPGPKPAGSDWPVFKPTNLGSQFSIIHKWQQGVVDLQINGETDQFDQLTTKFQNTEFEVIPTGKSISIRIRVRSINRFSSFESELEAPREGIQAAVRLLDLATRDPILT